MLGNLAEEKYEKMISSWLDEGVVLDSINQIPNYNGKTLIIYHTIDPMKKWEDTKYPLDGKYLVYNIVRYGERLDLFGALVPHIKVLYNLIN
jgi:hypothetical protein